MRSYSVWAFNKRRDYKGFIISCSDVSVHKAGWQLKLICYIIKLDLKDGGNVCASVAFVYGLLGYWHEDKTNFACAPCLRLY